MRVLAHVPEAWAATLQEQLPDVSIVGVALEGDVPRGLRGDVLYTWARGARNLRQLLPVCDVAWIEQLGTGVDEFPLELVGERLLTCSRGVSAQPIAEWVIAAMLAFEKRLPELWVTQPPERFLLATVGSLRGRTLGIVGLGAIGQQLARHALSFGMQVRAIRRTAAPPPVDGVEVLTSIGELLESSDHVVVAAPATPATRRLFDHRAFEMAKPGLHLVNIARGSLIDQDALRAALDAGTVARATLDTTTPEPLPAGHWMYAHPKVRLSPHVSWNAPGAIEHTIGSFAANVRRRITGAPLHGVVDVDAGY